jgi:hypothetical protein
LQGRLNQLGLGEVPFYHTQLFSALATLLSNTYAEPKYQQPHIRQGWEATDHGLKHIYAVAEKVGIPMIVLVLPSEIEFPPKYDMCRKRLPFPVNRYYPGQRISSLFLASSVPVLTFVDRFHEHLHEVTPYIDGHLNPVAQKIVAEDLAEAIGDLLPEMVYYNLADIVGFDQKGAGRRYCAYGISQPSEGTSWTMAEKAGIHFRLSPTKKPLIMKLRAIPFAPKELGTDQFVNIYCNGKKIGRWTLSGRDIVTYQALIPVSSIGSDGVVKIVFEFSERRSPDQLGISPDNRLLGLALVDMVITTGQGDQTSLDGANKKADTKYVSAVSLDFAWMLPT